MSEVVTIVTALVGAVLVWTASVASLVLWLTSRFSTVEALVHSEMARHRRQDDEQFYLHATRLQRLELKAFGFTHTGDSLPEREVRP